MSVVGLSMSVADKFDLKKNIRGFTSDDFKTLRGLVQRVWHKSSSDSYLLVEDEHNPGCTVYASVPPRLRELLSLR